MTASGQIRGRLRAVFRGRRHVGLQSLVDTGATPLARLVTVLIGIAIAAPLIPKFEADYVAPLRRDVRRWHALIAFAASAGVGVLLATFLAEPNIWALPRLVTFWTFLAIISAVVLGGRFGWLLPVIAGVGIALLGRPDAASSWNIVMSIQHSPLLWGITALTVAWGSFLTLR